MEGFDKHHSASTLHHEPWQECQVSQAQACSQACHWQARAHCTAGQEKHLGGVGPYPHVTESNLHSGLLCAKHLPS